MLNGFTVGITADRRWQEQAALFERRGAAVQHGPTIRTLAVGAEDRLRAATEAVIARRPSALVANTGVGIRSWFTAAQTWGIGDDLLEALRPARIYARGPKASGAIHSAGLDVEERATTERLREAVDAVLAAGSPGDAVALQLDGRGSSEETERLRAGGLDVIEIPVYDWTLPEDDGPAVRLAEGTIAGRVHAVTFTAGPAIRNWMAIAAEHGLDEELRTALTDGRAVVGCVGPACAEVAVSEGLASPFLVVPEPWRLGPLVRAVAAELDQRTVAIDVKGTSLVVTGTVAVVDGEAVKLSDTEAQLLTTLARQPDVVHTKTDLLRLVWRDPSADPHVVEAVVNRMRRRLGAVGPNIGSVYRRGYALWTR